MLHLEKKLRWPADDVSPSYESLCLRLSDGPLWFSLGAEISMLLLLSLLLELRPGLDSPSRPVLSWSKGREESTTYCMTSSHDWKWHKTGGVDVFSEVSCWVWEAENVSESVGSEWIWVTEGRRRKWEFVFSGRKGHGKTRWTNDLMNDVHILLWTLIHGAQGA